MARTFGRRLVQLLLNSIQAAVGVDEVVDELSGVPVAQLRVAYPRLREERTHLRFRQVVNVETCQM